VVCIAGGALAPGSASAAALIRIGTGANAAAIQPSVDQFRVDLGGADNGTGGTFTSGRREIAWDGVPDSSAEPNTLPFNFFNTTSPKGVVFQSVGNLASHTFSVSADSSNPTLTAPEFGNVNASYPAIFTPFSAERLFRAVGSTTVEVQFYVPGTNIPATVRGFGLVLADNDGGSYIEGYAANGAKLAGFTVNTFDNGLSFLGFSFTAGERIARVVIGAGNLPMAASNNDGGSGADVVAMDDFIYGEPRPVPSSFRFAESQFASGEGSSATVSVVRSGLGSASIDFAMADGTAGAADYTPSSGTLSFAPGETVKTISVPLAADGLVEADETVNLTLSNPVDASLGSPSSATLSIVDRPPAVDTTPPSISLARVRKRMKLAAFRRGVVVRVTPSEPSTIDLELLGSANRAVLSRLGDLTLASKRLRGVSGTRKVRLRPRRRLLSSSSRAFTARLRITATDAAGNRKVVERRIRVVP
jgi:hypothetical protein